MQAFGKFSITANQTHEQLGFTMTDFRTQYVFIRIYACTLSTLLYILPGLPDDEGGVIISDWV